MAERVRVGVRIRPFLPEDPDDADLTTLVVDPTHVTVGGNRIFTVDHVYRMEDDTTEVYNSSVRPMIQEFLTGYHVTVMAYGQTGTGKTYTINGLMPLIVRHVVEEGFAGSTHGLSFQFIEVYGESLRDLLSEDPVQSAKSLQLYDGSGSPNTDGSNADTNGSYVAGAHRFAARSTAEINELFAHGTRMRATGPTNMNEHSSRSHSVFTIFNHEKRNKLFVVDLAGSERNKKTLNVGQRFQESIAINTGLFALGNVIRALSRNHGSSMVASGHVPYRSSKLTRLLQDGLGGSGKTVFLACVAPDSHNRDETLRTLQYCSLATKILNTPMLQYEQLHQEQIKPYRRNRVLCSYEIDGDIESIAAVSKAQQMEEEVMHFKEYCSQQEAEITAMREQALADKERLRLCEQELRVDQDIFSKQVKEIKMLLQENDELRHRVVSLEGGAPLDQPCTKCSEGGDGTTVASMVQGILRELRQPPGDTDGGSQQPRRERHSSLLLQPPPSAAGVSLHSSSPWQHDTRPDDTAGLPDNGTGRRYTMAFEDPDKLPAAVAGIGVKAASSPPHSPDRDEQLLRLTQETLSYQTANTELRNQVSTVLSMLESQRREAALLKLELHEIHQMLNCR